jgi:hypothetical protein
MESKLVFEAPQFNKKTLYHIYNANNALIEKLKSKIALSSSEEKDIKNLPATYLICYLNNFTEAKAKLIEAQPLIKKLGKKHYEACKEALRILRKVKYS